MPKKLNSIQGKGSSKPTAGKLAGIVDGNAFAMLASLRLSEEDSPRSRSDATKSSALLGASEAVDGDAYVARRDGVHGA